MIQKRDDIVLTWRQVFDSKVPGRRIGEVALAAKRCFYKYINFNDRVYEVAEDDVVDTGLSKDDVR